MTWQPGTPIRTEEDWREWQEWRKESILVAQRKRRAKLRRIDYADVSPQAAAIIDGLGTSGTGGDLSSILNEIAVEFAGCWVICVLRSAPVAKRSGSRNKSNYGGLRLIL